MAEQDNTLDDDLTGLSDEERAAIQDSDPSDEALALEGLIGDDDAPGEGDEAANNDSADDDPGAEGDPDTDAAADAADELSEYVTELAVTPVQDYDVQMANIKADKDALRTKLDDGEIDLNEYEQQKDALVHKETQLLIQQNNALNAMKQNEHIAKQRWEWEQEQFFNRPASRIYSENVYLGAALNEAVKDLARNPANADKTGAFFLNEADRIIRKQFNLLAAQDRPLKRPSRTLPVDRIPPSLGGLPAAEAEDTGSGEFAHLEKLEGMELESALARLPKDQQDRYLRS